MHRGQGPWRQAFVPVGVVGMRHPQHGSGHAANGCGREFAVQHGIHHRRIRFQAFALLQTREVYAGDARPLLRFFGFGLHDAGEHIHLVPAQSELSGRLDAVGVPEGVEFAPHALSNFCSRKGGVHLISIGQDRDGAVALVQRGIERLRSRKKNVCHTPDHRLATLVASNGQLPRRFVAHFQAAKGAPPWFAGRNLVVAARDAKVALKDRPEAQEVEVRLWALRRHAVQHFEYRRSVHGNRDRDAVGRKVLRRPKSHDQRGRAEHGDQPPRTDAARRAGLAAHDRRR